MKKKFQLLLFIFCGLFSISTVYATTSNTDYFTIGQTAQIVCNPDTVEAGKTTNCYIVGKPDTNIADSTTASVHGFVTQAFVTDDLTLTGAGINKSITNANAVFTHKQELTGANLTGTNIPDQVAAVKCIPNVDWIDYTLKNVAKKDDYSDYACAYYYTNKDQTTNAFTPDKLKANADYKDTILKEHNDFGVVGYYEVKVAANTTKSICGSICIKAWAVPHIDDYGTININTTPGNAVDEYSKCQEIKLKPSTSTPGHTPEDPPTTGAFTSYIALTGSALIAIGAIAISKKNKKFNKI